MTQEGDRDGVVELYRSRDGSISLDVRADGETVWLAQQQLASLFGRDVSVIRRHISNARREELAAQSVGAKFALTAADGKTYQVEHYNLDMILSVGYRVKSPEGVHFRRWASEVLKDYLVKGAAVNDRRLEHIGSIVRVLSRSTDELVAGVADVLADFLPGLQLLRDYDEGSIEVPEGVAPGWELTIDEARAVIARVKVDFPLDNLFGRERGGELEGIVATIYQSFGGGGSLSDRAGQGRKPALPHGEGPPAHRREQAGRGGPIRNVPGAQRTPARRSGPAPSNQQCARSHDPYGRYERPSREGSDDHPTRADDERRGPLGVAPG